MPIIPTRLERTPDGVLYSSAFDDVYHSPEDALGQARHVFVAGNGLPERWQRRERFTIVETGFGAGLNFLATWAAWRDDALRCARLHFVSCERQPFRREDLALIHARWPAFAAQAAELQAQWPVLAPGLHRLNLDGGRVTLTLFLGDAADGLAQVVARADAFYLDGFAPAKNPDLWSARIFHLLARLAAPGATLATWSVAGSVREGLRRAGFESEKVRGFGGKWQMLRGHLARAMPEEAPPAGSTDRHALVIGAGIAGCTLVERLAERGWTIDLIDAAAAPGQGASGNLAGVLRPLPSLDDNRMSRLTRAGSLYGWGNIARLAARGFAVRADACGVLHLARDSAQEAKMRAVVERLALPPEHLAWVDGTQAAQIAGCAVAAGGWWFAGSGWVQPPSLCAASLAAAGERVRAQFGRHVAGLQREANGWLAIAADGSTIAAAPVVILAAGVDVRRFDAAGGLPVVSARGQVSHLPALPGTAPKVVVCRGGYVSPEVDGVRCAGATFAVDDDETALRVADHAENLQKLDAMLPGFASALSTATLAGRVGFRPASPDRLPMIGAAADASVPPIKPDLTAVVRQPGLYVLSGYGARGLVWSGLAAELLASQLEQDPLPLTRDLCEAIDPARFILRPPITGRIDE
ncbi:bifunctional tRNA (5-methylaminomethyl-2-thiouridine)(34)-methyltransferase MnmD/FAD-dependent 5-carboxymethylaminomethyl-2-thiouridine(34) oxidoreductase MnmC [Thauera sp.]|jgi:tRNA 5-methylaminomethyl-2-thiouridine biosynthesis bifunctional protein|uniref:bifunctional tRNA (5-methylaminomethyl-2-thiouridine)(34)-methyltransferase MnmD/FAD-dependent 5-carboxymethylaminomethyl-2-thiouridine(34) oxidoreductase MnmC n=1 Tax=Thauera sp. TaxID=1905334 RepID=UPI002A35FF56|nr:bifunctional tRNA (5-methylaminomethyl-2-thiouridine)(34)-methyltransferase MnmD/FAD-dependent 5-carboxymethylaminomethyl-2-thiouridine(34) oxidoreductase MnmC [Thauera sp.]MDX9885419.1 bifunctional tRNA (5-methylaminomethyl-2-thiouridine)(34)-methyltransferase MnmD/FAD-dependent 5-carboxymethylaminomethyl-2-thiouridine(34) oxidoreductase MnmC [Thauera sp.]